LSLLRSYLEANSVLSPAQLEVATRHQQAHGGSLDTALLELGLLGAGDLDLHLGRACGLPTVPSRLLETGPTRPWGHVPKALLDIGWAMPLALEDGNVLVAVHPDLPDARLGQLYRQIRGFMPMVAPECCLAKLAAERSNGIVAPRFAMLMLDVLDALQAREAAAAPPGAPVPEDRSSARHDTAASRPASPSSSAAKSGTSPVTSATALAAHESGTFAAASSGTFAAASSGTFSAASSGTFPDLRSVGAHAPGTRHGPAEPSHKATPPASPPVSQASPALPSAPPAAQAIPPVSQASPPVSQASPALPLLPPVAQALPPVSQALPPVSQASPALPLLPPVAQALPPVSQASPPVAQALPPVSQAIPALPILPPVAQASSPVSQALPPVSQASSPVSQALPPVSQASPSVSQAISPVAQASPAQPIISPVSHDSSPVSQATPAASGARSAPAPHEPGRADDLAQRLAPARAALVEARERDRITAALVQAAAQIAPRVALFGVRREGLRVLAVPGALPLPNSLVIPIPEGSLLDRAVLGLIRLKLLAEPTLAAAIGRPLGIPCLFEPVFAQERGVLMLYVDRDGGLFDAADHAAVRDLCDLASTNLEALLRTRGFASSRPADPANPSASRVTPVPTDSPAEAATAPSTAAPTPSAAAPTPAPSHSAAAPAPSHSAAAPTPSHSAAAPSHSAAALTPSHSAADLPAHGEDPAEAAGSTDSSQPRAEIDAPQHRPGRAARAAKRQVISLINPIRRDNSGGHSAPPSARAEPQGHALTPEPQASSGPLASPVLADSPRATDAPVLADSPRATDAPVLADSPRATDAPVLADSPRAAGAPVLADSRCTCPPDSPSIVITRARRCTCPYGQPVHRCTCPRGQPVHRCTCPRGQPARRCLCPRGQPARRCIFPYGQPARRCTCPHGQPARRCLCPRGQPGHRCPCPQGQPPADAPALRDSPRAADPPVPADRPARSRRHSSDRLPQAAIPGRHSSATSSMVSGMIVDPEDAAPVPLASRAITRAEPETPEPATPVQLAAPETPVQPAAPETPVQPAAPEARGPTEPAQASVPEDSLAAPSPVPSGLHLPNLVVPPGTRRGVGKKGDRARPAEPGIVIPDLRRRAEPPAATPILSIPTSLIAPTPLPGAQRRGSRTGQYPVPPGADAITLNMPRLVRNDVAAARASAPAAKLSPGTGAAASEVSPLAGVMIPAELTRKPAPAAPIGPPAAPAPSAEARSPAATTPATHDASTHDAATPATHDAATPAVATPATHAATTHDATTHDAATHDAATHAAATHDAATPATATPATHDAATHDAATPATHDAATHDATMEPTGTELSAETSATAAVVEAIADAMSATAQAADLEDDLSSETAPAGAARSAPLSEVAAPADADAVLEAYLNDPDDPEARGALARLGPAGLERVAARFPGPIDLGDQSDARSFPPPSAHGPLLRACVEIGPTITPYILELLEYPRPQLRFYAAFVFQELRDPRCLRALAQHAFDPDAEVRLIATRVLESYSRVEGFIPATELVRAELRSRDRERALLAAEAAGTLRDTQAVYTLIELLSVRDKQVRETALEALCSITAKHLGYRPAKWRAWYDEHGQETRVEWVIEALRHRDAAVRRWAADELVRITGHRVTAPAGEKLTAKYLFQAWQQWWAAGAADRG
jgi:HEAT repeat protein